MLTNRVIDINKNIADAYVIQSKMALLDKKLVEAREQAKKAKEIDAKNREAMFAFAQAEQKLSNFDAAESWYRKAINSHEDKDRKSNIHYWLAQMFLEMKPKNATKARDAMQHMADLSPKAPWKLVNYAIFLNTSTTDYEMSIKYAQASLEQMEFGMGRHALGMALYAKWSDKYMKAVDLNKKDNTAEREIEKIVNETGISPDKAYQYASQYMRKSRIPEALVTAGALK